MTGAVPHIGDDKRALRKACETRRASIRSSQRRKNAEAVAAIGIGFAGVSPRLVVSAYSSLGTEIDPSSLLARLADDGYETALPVTPPLGHPLMFRAWRPGEALVARKWGILEPEETAIAVEPDVLLIPLLAFDRCGGRLGYGGGYYDRTLARLRGRKRIVAIGLAFAEQEIAAVPVQQHDQKLDWVLTPDGVIDTRGT